MTAVCRGEESLEADAGPKVGLAGSQLAQGLFRCPALPLLAAYEQGGSKLVASFTKTPKRAARGGTRDGAFPAARQVREFPQVDELPLCNHGEGVSLARPRSEKIPIRIGTPWTLQNGRGEWPAEKGRRKAERCIGALKSRPMPQPDASSPCFQIARLPRGQMMRRRLPSLLRIEGRRVSMRKRLVEIVINNRACHSSFTVTTT